IVPQDRPLVIQSRIDPTNIDQVFVGQDVTLRFAAFDQRTTPELFGKVVKLSADAFVDEASRTSYYRAEIAPNPEEYEKLKGLELLPGMPVETFIRTDDRTPMSFLLKPLADYFNKAFR
ncbi:MAG: HlyD family efflux transporter periplasmic adaptor subunit, partial [Alphaproteobacteria bacterium]|nr:HlyD family efflux transporter periplasmic adaptor subunit [Alphaproteobacteria bacterium]